ncbi:methylenetetrahydrofolate reductase [NAD(P)H] [Desertihabitans brevis]|uniref:methylenetetrahydrofolate reductase [NAD(P)H] n=1 Tax=Desertihabitans brevis TaxID=2268447 RepID=UPI001F448859|nr:methylenetetrahydrofolate reductase [NAD(P)H] [Desertihabitans brevis]
MPVRRIPATPRPAARTPRQQPVADLLATADCPLTSFELFPWRSPEEERVFWQTTRELEALGPDFVSVTYGASGSTRDRTVGATEAIASHTTLNTMAHLTCASQSRDELRRTIGAYAGVGIRNVLAIRGDMPGGPTVPFEQHPDGLANATELVRMVRELGDFCVGVAAFPDLHPQAHDADLDARVLVQKAEAGASFAITQLFFTFERYVDLVQRVRALGCDLPIIPGIMPVTRLTQISRMAELSGADLPDWVVRRLSEDESPATVRQVGIDIATELCERLLEHGVPGLHFITMNRSTATREIFGRVLGTGSAARTPAS